jgi:hypothetical protein
LIVYKNITYFPMTWSDCRFLGVETRWDGSALHVDTNGDLGAFAEEKTEVKNRASYKASIPDWPVYINGRLYEQHESEWPFLIFRDVTYFPMIWQYTAVFFGWKINFNPDPGIGLIIDSSGIWNDNHLYIDLPVRTRDSVSGAVCAFTGQTVYYEGKDGRIYSAPLDAVQKAKAIYDLPVWSYGRDGDYVYPALRAEDGRVFLTYHQGGASMGEDYNLLLGPDGVVETLPGRAARAIDGWLVAVDDGGMPHAENLWARGGEDASFKPVGDPDLVHSFSDGITLKGTGLFTAAQSITPYAEGGGWPGDAYVYRTDLETGTSSRVTGEPLGPQGTFYIGNDDYVYYQNKENRIRRQRLSGGQAETVLPETVSDFALTSDGLYYVPVSWPLPYRLGDNEPVVTPDGIVTPGFENNAYTELAVWNDTLYARIASGADIWAEVLIGDQIFVYTGENTVYATTGTYYICTDGVRLLSIRLT